MGWTKEGRALKASMLRPVSAAIFHSFNQTRFFVGGTLSGYAPFDVPCCVGPCVGNRL